MGSWSMIHLLFLSLNINFKNSSILRHFWRWVSCSHCSRSLEFTTSHSLPLICSINLVLEVQRQWQCFVLWSEYLGLLAVHCFSLGTFIDIGIHDLVLYLQPACSTVTLLKIRYDTRYFVPEKKFRGRERGIKFLKKVERNGSRN